MVSQFCDRPTSKRWFLKLIQVIVKHDPSMPCRNPCRLYIHFAFTYSIGVSSIVWRELGAAPSFRPMRVLEVQWSRTLGLVCEVALNHICVQLGPAPSHASLSSYQRLHGNSSLLGTNVTIPGHLSHLAPLAWKWCQLEYLQFWSGIVTLAPNMEEFPCICEQENHVRLN